MLRRPKTINALMAYLRDIKGISINGSTQKRKLRYMGYFHGYKGYRFCGKPSNLMSLTTFNEIQALYDFDMALKTMFYPRIMFLEMAIKNYALEVILLKTGSRRFADIYAQLLTGYKAYPRGSKEYRNAITKRMTTRNKVYSAIARDYEKFVVSHFYDKDEPLPIWAIFELLSFGEFANFVDCLNEATRKELSKNIGIKVNADRDGRMLVLMIYTLKDLRNAVAHNNIVFDTRFHTGGINRRIGNYITTETGIKGVNFSSIVDYVILICFLMKSLDCSKSETLNFIKSFETICENFRKAVSTQIFSKIVYTDTRNKLNILKKYI